MGKLILKTHNFVDLYLVVPSTKDKLGVGVVVQQTLNDLALVDGNGTDLQVHFTNKH